MSEVKNLSSEEAVEKLKKMADNNVSLFCTYTENQKMETRPMSTAGVDDDGVLWFICKAGSNVHSHLEKNNNVDVLYSNAVSQAYLAVKGKASVLYDKDLIDKYWTPIAKVWFEDKDDPSIRLLKVEPRTAHYWDTQHGKVISGLKMLFSVITGDHEDDGRQGDIKV